MVITKSGISTTIEKDTTGNINQTSKSALTLTTPTTQSTMKFDSTLQHILNTVLELGSDHPI